MFLHIEIVDETFSKRQYLELYDNDFDRRFTVNGLYKRRYFSLRSEASWASGRLNKKRLIGAFYLA
jgi:hypothetical protein